MSCLRKQTIFLTLIVMTVVALANFRIGHRVARNAFGLPFKNASLQQGKSTFVMALSAVQASPRETFKAFTAAIVVPNSVLPRKVARSLEQGQLTGSHVCQVGWPLLC